MTIEFRCAQCNQLLRVPDTSAGKNARCPKCKTLMQIPAAGAANIPPPPPMNFAPPSPGGYVPPPPLPGNFFPPPAQPGYGYPQQQPADFFSQPEPNPFDFSKGSRKSSSRSGVHQQSSAADMFAGIPGSAPSPPPPPPPPPMAPANPFDFASGSSRPSSSHAASTSSIGKSKGSKGQRTGLPWESGKKKGFEAFMETARLVAFDPSKAFSQMLQKGDMGQPMMYSAIGLGIGLLGMLVWNMLALVMFAGSLGLPAELIGAGMGYMIMSGVAYLVVGVPLAATLGNLIGGGVLHICLMICGGSKYPFDTSFRIACYVQSSLMWICWIPGGVLVIGIWSLVVAIFAVHKAHEVPMGRAVMTVLLPIIAAMALSMLMSFFVCGSIAALMPRNLR